MVDLADIPSLTRNGYKRTPRANVDIAALLGLGREELVEQFRDADETHAGHRCVEALIFFIRKAVADGDRRLVEALFDYLIKRCQGYFRSALRGLDEEARADLQSEILADLTRLLLASDDSGDFLQSRFWLCLRRRTVTARAQWIKRERRMAPTESEGDDDLPAIETADIDLSPEDRAILADALGRLPPELRELVILHHFEGWRIGDEPADRRDPEDPTLSELTGITPRGVRKRLARAKAMLADRKDQE